MTVHISEIGVQLAIGSPTDAPQDAQDDAGAVTLAAAQREAIVQECTRRVLAALSAQQAR